MKLTTTLLFALALSAGCAHHSGGGGSNGGGNTIDISATNTPVPFCGTANFHFSTEWGNATFTPPSGNPLPVLMWNGSNLDLNPDQALTDLGRPIEGGWWHLHAEHDGKTGEFDFQVDALKLWVTEKPTTFGNLGLTFQNPDPGTLEVFRDTTVIESENVAANLNGMNFALDQTELFFPHDFHVRLTVDGKHEERSFHTLGSTLGVFVAPLTQGVVMDHNGGSYYGFFRVWVGRTNPGEELEDPTNVGFNQELVPNAPVKVTLRVLGQDIVVPDPMLPITGVTNAAGQLDVYFSVPLQYIFDLLPPSYDPYAMQQPPRSLIVQAWSSPTAMVMDGERTQEYDLAVLADNLGNNHWIPLKSSAPTLRFPKASSLWTPIENQQFVIATELQGFAPDNSDIEPNMNKMCVQQVVLDPGSQQWVPKGNILHEPLHYDSVLHRWATDELTLPAGRYCAWSFMTELPTYHDVGGMGLFFWVRRDG